VKKTIHYTIKIQLTLILVMISYIGLSQCGPLSTPYNQNNGQDGIMFDVVALTSVEITNFDINCGGGTHDFEIYYRTGTHVGFQNNAAGWNLIATANGVNGPVNVATAIPATFSVVLCAGDVGAFYITSTGTGSIDYTNGTGVGNVLAADANLQVLEGTGKDYPFAASFNPRNPNVTVYYNCLTMSCCAVQAINATPGPCVANQYSTTGTIDVMNPPATGTLTVEDCNGNQQIINAPFTSPINFNLTGQTADGGPCTISATFSDDPSCTMTENYTAPAPCTTCSIDNLTVNVGACDPNTNTFGVSGTIAFTDDPGTGSLVIEIDNGSNVLDTTINAPFAGPYNWSISGIDSDNSNYTVNAYFTDDLACTATDNFTAPYPCACIAQIGNFTPVITGQSTNNYVLCYGDDLTILSNMDNVNPYEMFNPPGPAYDPGIGWAMYSCPPTVALTPNATTVLADDPCFLGFFGTGNFYDLNDGSTIAGYPPGTFTDNTIYYVPVTMYSMSAGVESYVNAGLPCYETGPVYAVQYLEDFTYSILEDCQTGTATVTVNGADPQYNGTDFTASALVPGSAAFGNTTAGHGGTIDVTGLGNNANYSFTIADVNGCTYPVNGGPFPVLEDASFSYSAGAYCQDVTSTTPTITGTAGGTFSSSAGLILDPTTGTINIPASTPGSYDITYTTPDAVCFTTSTVTVQINALPMVDAGMDQDVCTGDNVVLTATGADTYAWDNGIANGTVFNPSTTLTYTVVGTDANGCQNSDDVDVNVYEYPVPDFTFTPSVTTKENTTIYFSNSTTNADSYFWTFGDGVGTSTDTDPEYFYPEEPGNYIITLVATSNNGMCVDSISKQLVVEDVVTFYIPNTFTPNGDEFNNRFTPVFTSGYDPYDFHMVIFNRWGEIVWESYNPAASWDGHYGDGGIVPEGVYTWTIEFKANLSDKRYEHRGHVTVLK
jgi:gliding motility-associated-like protein